ncbi:sugar transferase [Neptunomonas sp.]|uniref:sugar transferase n=1 Tax=Neptunomonas sp. TaxID=1971898 RepID=UPI0035698D76
MKRTFDVVVAFIVLLLCLPLMLVVALFIKLESKGPALFKQQRIGKDGRLFSIYKFRSMVVGAEKVGPHFTSDYDPRITKGGRFVRKTSLDELPQLLNVLKGDMSLVGPRPNVPEQRSEYTEEEWAERNKVRPGITGLAQAVKRSQATPVERTQLDLEYVRKSSFLFDVYVILLTVKQIVLKGGN